MTTKQQQKLKLMKLFKFTEEDLTANRDGYMSKRQRARWRRKRSLDTIGFRFGQIVLILLLAGMVQLTVKTNGIIWLAFVGALMALFVLWALGDLLNPSSDYKADLHKGDVSTICGRMTRIANYRAYHSSLYPLTRIQIGDIEFRVSNDQYAAFEDNKQYCIYYMPDSNNILSAEELD